jgi:hypothetical protein
MLHRLRLALQSKRGKIGETVEFDETYIGANAATCTSPSGNTAQ